MTKRNDQERIDRLLEREPGLTTKVKELGASPRAMLRRLAEDVQTILRMLKAWRAGAYHPSRRSITIAILALGYFLNPLDLVPDFIPVLGLLDDLLVYLAVMMLLRSELDRFRKWEAASPQPSSFPRRRESA